MICALCFRPLPTGTPFDLTPHAGRTRTVCAANDTEGCRR